MNSRLNELFGGVYRCKLLRELYLNRSKGFAVVALAERAKVDPGNASRLLNKWARLGLVHKQVDGRNVRFQASDDPLLAALTEIFLRGDSLLEDIRQTLPRQVEVAVVFGSVARGQEQADSDVDVLALGPGLGQIKVNAAMRAVGRKHKRDINVSVYSQEEFEKMLRDDDGFARNVIAHRTIPLKGDLAHVISKAARPEPR